MTITARTSTDSILSARSLDWLLSVPKYMSLSKRVRATAIYMPRAIHGSRLGSNCSGRRVWTFSIASHAFSLILTQFSSPTVALKDAESAKQAIANATFDCECCKYVINAQL